MVMTQTTISLLATLCIVVGGCDLGTEPENQPVTTIVDGVRYTLTFQHIVFSAPDTCDGNLKVDNITTETIDLQFPSQHALRWRLLNENDQEVLTNPTVGLIPFSNLTLSPHGTYHFGFQLVLKDNHNIVLRSGVYRFELGLDRPSSPYLQKLIYIR